MLEIVISKEEALEELRTKNRNPFWSLFVVSTGKDEAVEFHLWKDDVFRPMFNKHIGLPVGYSRSGIDYHDKWWAYIKEMHKQLLEKLENEK